MLPLRCGIKPLYRVHDISCHVTVMPRWHLSRACRRTCAAGLILPDQRNPLHASAVAYALILGYAACQPCAPCNRVSDVYNTGNQLASEPLTPALAMLDLRPHQPCYMEQVVRMCAALRQAVASLQSSYADGRLKRLAASSFPAAVRLVTATTAPQASCGFRCCCQAGCLWHKGGKAGVHNMLQAKGYRWISIEVVLASCNYSGCL